MALRHKLSMLIKNQKTTYIISFPKCGRTWLRMMLGYTIARQLNISFSSPSELLELKTLRKRNACVPKILIKHDDEPFWKKPGELETDKGIFKRDQVVFLVRDPRDVLISSYFEKTRRDFVYRNQKKYEGTLSQYVNESVGGFETLLAYYNIWFENRNIPRKMLLVRYEDMHASPERELGRVLQFVGIKNVHDSLIAGAVVFSSFDNMKKMEAIGSGSWRLSPADRNDPESYKARKGKVGGYRDYLDEQQIEHLTCLMNKKLSPWFNYKF